MLVRNWWQKFESSPFSGVKSLGGEPALHQHVAEVSDRRVTENFPIAMRFQGNKKQNLVSQQRQE